MSEIAIEWIALLLFLVLFVGVIVAEMQWLVRKGWASSGRAVGFVMVTDLLGFGIGSGVVLAIFVIMLMMTFGPAGRGGDSPESYYWIAIIFAVIFPPIFLITAKRLFLLIFKIKSGKTAWIYSLLSSFLVFVIVLVPPPLVYYLIGYASIWKH